MCVGWPRVPPLLSCTAVWCAPLCTAAPHGVRRTYLRAGWSCCLPLLEMSVPDPWTWSCLSRICLFCLVWCRDSRVPHCTYCMYVLWARSYSCLLILCSWGVGNVTAIVVPTNTRAPGPLTAGCCYGETHNAAPIRQVSMIVLGGCKGQPRTERQNVRPGLVPHPREAGPGELRRPPCMIHPHQSTPPAASPQPKARVRWRDGVYKPEAHAGEPSHFSLLHFPFARGPVSKALSFLSALAASLSLLFLCSNSHS